MHTDEKYLDIYVSASLKLVENNEEVQVGYAKQVEGIIIKSTQEKDPEEYIRAVIREWRDSKTPSSYEDFWRRYYKGEVTLAVFCEEIDELTDRGILAINEVCDENERLKLICTLTDNRIDDFDIFYEVYKIVTGLEAYLTTMHKKHQQTTPSTDFADYLLCDEVKKQEVLYKLRSLFKQGITGKPAATILIALHSLGWMLLPERGKSHIYRAINHNFELDLANQDYQPYIQFTNSVLKPVIPQPEIQNIIDYLQQ